MARRDIPASTGLFDALAPRPLADRLRPKTLAEIVGQDHLLSADGPIGRMVASGRLSSMVLWGPPGCGKTTLARLLAEHTKLHFEPLSAVFSGVADLRRVFEAARSRRAAGEGTLLFIDEIHRFNRAQQDGFLPYVEDGEPLLRAQCRAAVARAGLRPQPPRRQCARATAAPGRADRGQGAPARRH